MNLLNLSENATNQSRVSETTKPHIFFFFLMSCLSAFVSCSAEAYILLNPDLTGEADLNIQVSDVLFRYYQDITGNYNANTIFNPLEILSEFEQRPGITVSHISLPRNDTLKMAIAFENINTLLRNESQRAITEDFLVLEDIERGQGQKKLSINLNENTIPALLSLGPVSNNILSDYLLPLPGTRSDPISYREDLVWALEEYENTSRLRKRIDAAQLSLIFLLPNKPITVQNGQLSAPSSGSEPADKYWSVKFTIPILNLLTLSIQESFFIIY